MQLQAQPVASSSLIGYALEGLLAPLLLVGQPQALVPLQRVLPQVLQVVLVLLPGWMLQVLLLSLQVLLLLLLLALAWEPGPAEAGQPGQPELALALQVQEQSRRRGPRSLPPPSLQMALPTAPGPIEPLPPAATTLTGSPTPQ